MDFLPLSDWVPPAHRDTSSLRELKGHFKSMIVPARRAPAAVRRKWKWLHIGLGVI